MEGLSPSASAVELADLGIEGPEIVENPHETESEGEEVEEACAPFAHVETVDTEAAQEGEEDPSH